MILVTGAAGFIGHHLVPRILEDEDVVGLDVNGEGMNDLTQFGSAIIGDGSFTPIVGDITDEARMNAVAGELSALVKGYGKKKIEACIHLAAIASPPIAQKDPTRAWATNVQGTHNVLQLLRKVECPKVVFFSSAHVYGISPKYMPTDESHPLALLDTYTTTKIMGEELFRLFYENHGIGYTTLRLWNAYGMGQSKDYFLGVKIAQALAGKLTIRNGGVTKDWIHITDVVRATIAAYKSSYVGPLNVGTGIETNLRTIVDMLSKAFGGLEVVEENVETDGPSRMQCDNTRIKRTLGWEPKVRFGSGLAALVEEAKVAHARESLK